MACLVCSRHAVCCERCRVVDHTGAPVEKYYCSPQCKFEDGHAAYCAAMHPLQQSYHRFIGVFGLPSSGRHQPFYRTTYGFDKFSVLSYTFQVGFLPITGGGYVTPLMRAAASNDLPAVARLLKAGAAADAFDAKGCTVMWHATPCSRLLVKTAVTVLRLANHATLEVYIRQGRAHHIQWLQGMPTRERVRCTAWARGQFDATIREQCLLLCILRSRGHAKHTRDAKLMLAFLALSPRAAQTLAALEHL